MRVKTTPLFAVLALISCSAPSLPDGEVSGPLDSENCDEGFEGPGCLQRNADYGARFRVLDGLADPDVLRLSDDQYLLSGTRAPTVNLPLYTSSDLKAWTLAKTYSPASVDPAHDYCWVWAPDLSQTQQKPAPQPGGHHLPCGAPLGTLDFGAPQPLFEGTSGPRTYRSRSCPPEGCDRAIRIDGTYDPEDDRLYYVFFDRGNNVASFPLSNPGAILHHTLPVHPFEEGINEGPELFRRAGQRYLFFSSGHFKGQYAMHYVVGGSANELTRQRSLRRLSTPVVRRDGKMAETHGHNSITTRHGEAFNFFHVGIFDASGALVRRDTWRQRMIFRPDGSAVSHNAVRVRWGQLPGARYSLDLVLRDGTVVGPCIDAALIGSEPAVTFTGICPGSNDRLIHKSAVAAFRIYWSTTGIWNTYAEVPYDGVSDAAYVPLPNARPGAVGLSWSERETGTEYSLDVRNAAGRWTAPCVGDGILRNRLEYEFDGACATPGTRVELGDVSAFRLCAARNGNWAAASCKEVPFSGSSAQIAF
jgi:hypothetical protein